MSAQTGQVPAGAAVLRIVEAQGTVEVLPAGAATWVLTTTNQVLHPHDQLRTGPNSRVAILSSSQAVERLGALTVIEILPPHASDAHAGLNILRGILSFFHREPPGRIRTLTQGAVAGVEGTEFVLKVQEINGIERTTVYLIDGRVVLTNALGTLVLTNGQQGVVNLGQAPQPAPSFVANNILQWCFYYPAVLDLQELPLTAEEERTLGASLAAYRSGDLPAALRAYPRDARGVSDAQRLYHAALLLAVGQVEETHTILGTLTVADPAERLPRLAAALRLMIDTVKGQATPPGLSPLLTTERLAASYYEQSRAVGDESLHAALRQARQAAAQSPGFAFAWARLAELEFSFGRTARAREAVERSATLAPRNAQALALRGFLQAAQNNTASAIDWFNQALAVDGALANAWLGRGLCRIRRGNTAGGREDLLIAAALEPQRSVLRSYLGKAYSNAGDTPRGSHELDLAKVLDPADPTPWLYSALLNEQNHRFNAGIRDLEISQSLNENRRLYRSQLLLDQDRAVRSSSLANLYRDAAMPEVSVREAARAVSYDYANYSAHLFLAESYDALRDPTRFNLRYETVWFNELLLANLLAPVGGTPLSQNISQQEYTRLFERDRVGLSSETTYRSDGQWRELASQYGNVGNTGWAIDVDYQHNQGARANNELDRFEWYTTVKQQITPQDSVLLLTKYQDYHSGDNFQYYEPEDASRHYTVDAYQQPLLFGAYHREWAPGVHTLVGGARLVSDQRVKEKGANQLLLATNALGQVTNAFEFLIDPFQNDIGGLDVDYHSEFEIYSVELNQIIQRGRITDVFGARYQEGNFETDNRLFNVTPPLFAFLFPAPPASGSFEEDFDRLTAYLYHTWEVWDRLFLTGGVSYDRLTFPENFRHPPLGPGSEERDRWSPKAALVWGPSSLMTLRGAYTRSLGGASFDESFRLEPTQLAGFSQAFRTLLSESVGGSVAAPEFETAGAGLDLTFPGGTYLGFQGELLHSEVDRVVGVFDWSGTYTPLSVQASSTREDLDYDEYALTATFNQRVGEEWSLGGRYRFIHSELDDVFREVPPAALSRETKWAELQEGRIFAVYNHASGFFGQVQTRWYHQHNSDLPGEDFFQHDAFMGYRLPRHRAEIMVGLMNLTDEDYHLNPLNPYSELPRERVFLAQFKFRF